MCFYNFRDWQEVQGKLKEIIEATVEEFLEPVKNELIPRSD